MKDELLEEIFSLFKKQEIHAGGVLPKTVLSKHIQSLSPELKLQLRDTWHYLIMYNIIQEGNPLGPTLTEIGEQIVYSED